MVVAIGEIILTQNSVPMVCVNGQIFWNIKRIGPRRNFKSEKIFQLFIQNISFDTHHEVVLCEFHRTTPCEFNEPMLAEIYVATWRPEATVG